MTEPEHLRHVTLFIAALYKLRQAQTAGTGVTFTTDETDALADTLRFLTVGKDMP